MRNVNEYLVYREETRKKGCVTAEFVFYAWSESHVREMAEEKGINLDGYTIDCTREDVRTPLRRPVEPCVWSESLQSYRLY